MQRRANPLLRQMSEPKTVDSSSMPPPPVPARAQAVLPSPATTPKAPQQPLSAATPAPTIALPLPLKPAGPLLRRWCRRLRPRPTSLPLKPQKKLLNSDSHYTYRSYSILANPTSHLSHVQALSHRNLQDHHPGRRGHFWKSVQGPQPAFRGSRCSQADTDGGRTGWVPCHCYARD
jgi:hypothetical protein